MATESILVVEIEMGANKSSPTQDPVAATGRWSGEVAPTASRGGPLMVGQAEVEMPS